MDKQGTENIQRVIKFEGILNARELGGIALSDGRKVKNGCLIRSSRLSKMTEADKHILTNEWGLTTIVDLRNDQEISEHPDREIEGVTFLRIPLSKENVSGVSREEKGEGPLAHTIHLAESMTNGAKRLLQELYPKMVTQDFCIGQISKFFEALLEHEDGALLWHCTSGKDRTGITGALLLLVLGASWDTIMDDYLYSNAQNREYRDNLCRLMESHGVEPRLIKEIYTLESVDASYLESCITAIKEKFGSIDVFLTEAVGITSEIKAKLREKYTC